MKKNTIKHIGRFSDKDVEGFMKISKTIISNTNMKQTSFKKANTIHYHTGGIEYAIKNIFSKRSINYPKSKACLYLEADSSEGINYLNHINFALDYARENRKENLYIY